MKKRCNRGDTMKRFYEKHMNKIRAAVGILMILGAVLTVVFGSKMRVDGNTGYDTHIANVKSALTALETGGTEVDIPFTAEQLTASGKTAFDIYDYYDWMALMVLSYENSLEGYTFYVDAQADGRSVYDLQNPVSINGTDYSFEGIGLHQEHPFKGNLVSKFGDTGITLNVNRALFGYLDASAKVNLRTDEQNTVFTVNLVRAVNQLTSENVYPQAGLAQVLTGSGEVLADNIKNLVISGTVENLNGYAGGLFGEIQGLDEANPLILTSVGADITNISEVSGACVGGIAGKVIGNVQISVNSFLWTDNKTITGIPNADLTTVNACAGIFFGDVEGEDVCKPVITIAEDTTITVSTVSGGNYVGSIAGRVKNGTISIDNPFSVSGTEAPVDISGTGDAIDYSGGIVGYVEDSIISGTGEIITAVSGKSAYVGSVFGYVNNSTIDLETVSLNGEFLAGTYGGGFIGRSNTSHITVAALNVNGSVFSSYGWEYAGGIVGRDKESVYTFGDVQYADSSVSIISTATGCCLGGFAGSMEGTECSITNSSAENKVVIPTAAIKAESATNTSDKSVYLGGVVGKYINTTGTEQTIENFAVNDITIYTKADTYDNYVGGIAGAIEKASDAGTAVEKTVISNCEVNTLQGFSSTKKTQLGGILGVNFVDGTLITDVSAKLGTHWGRDRSSQTVGGVLGRTKADCEIINAYDMLNTQYTGSRYSASNSGGVIGVVEENIYVKITDVSFFKGSYSDLGVISACLSNSYNSSACVGGLIGVTKSGTIADLNGNLDFTNLRQGGGNVFGYYGSIVGSQTDSLIFVNPTGYEEATGSYIYGITMKAERYADEVGSYGSVYRNGNLDSDTPATDLSDKDEWLISVNEDSQAVIKSDTDPYSLSTKGDFSRLSIALNTEDLFTGFDKETNSCATLLAGAYTLENDIDISDTGIQTLTKNDKAGKQVFTGSLMSATGQKYTITYDLLATHQASLGLFSNVGTGATFSDFAIVSKMKYSNYYDESLTDPRQEILQMKGGTAVAYQLLGNGMQNYGSLAANAEGTVTIDNVTANVEYSTDHCLADHSAREKYRFVGGLIGKYITKAGETLSISNIMSNVDMTVSEAAHFAGGVVGYVQNDASGGTVSLENVTVSGDIYSLSDGRTGNTDTKDNAPIGGVISTIGNVSYTDEQSVPEKIDVSLKDITISGLQIHDYMLEADERSYQCGGLVGYLWRNADVAVDGLVVQNGTAVVNDTQVDKVPGIVITGHSKGAIYGGLWNSIWGHADLQNVDIQSMNISVPGTTQIHHNGLLMGRGQYLYMELEGYTISTVADAVRINDASALYFDEIVGYNQGSAVNQFEENCGGVVSVNGLGDYVTYVNKVVKQENPNTRYYYDLNTDLQGVTPLTSNDLSVDSVSKMLQWSLAHYVNQPLRSQFAISDSYAVTGETVTFSGTIDLLDSGFYPVTVAGGTYSGTDSATIIFHGKDFDAKTTEYKTTNAQTVDRATYIQQEISENHLLHSGLFENVTQSNISNLTLKGSVTAHEKDGVLYSGSLITGSILGVETGMTEGSEYINYDPTPTNITEIVLDGMSVSHITNDNWDSYYGLLVGAVEGGAKVHFGPEEFTDNTMGVSMINYNGYTDKVASALVGRVGYTDAQGMNVTFTNMQIADVADGIADGTLVDREASAPDAEKMDLAGAKVLAKASLIYHYQYRLDNTTGVYIFYLDDYKGQNVTLGKEIGDKVQFYDNDLTQTIKDYTAGGAHDCLEYNPDNYKPYVYTCDNPADDKKDIDVNPKNGHILEGCGTYDDPYVIETSTQFMTLYYYLNDHDRYKSTLLDWEINEFGTDTVENGEVVVQNPHVHNVKHYNIGLQADADDAIVSQVGTYESLTAGGFPTVEQLSNAYYKITKPLDLSEEDDFVGFGTEDLPFTGVLIGEYEPVGDGTDADVVQSMITLPTTATTGVKTYGLIRYAKGAVVRNLHLNLVTGKVNIASGGTAAVVMNTVLGGDNVIDNVKVTGEMKTLAASGVSYGTAAAYVGELQKGALLLRGYQPESLKNFAIRIDGATMASVPDVGTFRNGIVGKVLDGFVVDDDTNCDVSAVYKANPASYFAGDSASATAPLDGTDTSNMADINGSLPGAATITDCIAVLDHKTDKIAVSQDETNGYEYSLNSAQDLLAVSFAMNSGAMNYWGNENLTTGPALTPGDYGYDVYSRCRNVDYSYVGNVTLDNEAAKTAYLQAVKFDNRNPYTNDGTQEYIFGGKTYNTSFYHPYIFQFFEFDADVEIFRTTNYDGDTFSSAYTAYSALNQYFADVAGNKKYISTYNMAEGTYDLSAPAYKKCFQGIGSKDILTNVPYSLHGNFIGAGSGFADGSTAKTIIKIDLDYTKYQDAALFTLLYGGNNIGDYVYSVQGFDLQGDVRNTRVSNGAHTMAAGIAPRMNGQYKFQDVVVTDMVIDSTVTPNLTYTTSNPQATVSGAFLARADYMGYANNKVDFEDCAIRNTTVKAWDNCGGFFATNENNAGGQNNFTNCKVENSTFNSNRGNLGGFVGYTNYPVNFTECKLNKSTISRVHVADISVAPPYAKDDSIIAGVGGFAGCLDTGSTATGFVDCDINVFDGVVDTDITTVSYTPYMDTKQYHNVHVGGIVGASVGAETDVLSFRNCDVNNLDLVQRTISHVGGFVGLNAKTLEINTEADSSSEINNVSIARSFMGATGGVVGRNGGEATSETPTTIKNINFTGLEIIQGWEGECFTGGIMGYQQGGQLEMENVHLLGTKKLPVNIQLSIGNPGTNRLYVGGLIGRYYYNWQWDDTQSAITDCAVMGEENEAGESYVTIRNAQICGGFVGSYVGKALEVTNANVSNTIIQILKNDKSTANECATAGGLIGDIGYQDGQTDVGKIDITDTTMSNVALKHIDPAYSANGKELTEKQNTVLESSKSGTVVLGGMVGRLRQKTVNLKGFSIDKLSIGEDGYGGHSGGVLGEQYSGSFDVTMPDNSNIIPTNTLQNSKIVSSVAGGVIGECNKWTNINGVRIVNTTILARNDYYKDKSTWEYNAGGIVGRNLANVFGYRYENIVIEDSVIAACRNTNDTLAKTSIGGLIGVQTKGIVRTYKVSMKNPLIGYLTDQSLVPTYAQVADGTAGLQRINSSSSDGTGVTTVLEPITSDDVLYASKEYGLGAGTWIGNSKADAKGYFLLCSVNYDDDLKQFHPAVDVGLNTTNLAPILADDTQTIYDVYETYMSKLHLLYGNELVEEGVAKNYIGTQLGYDTYEFAKLEKVLETFYNGNVVDENVDYRLDFDYKQRDEQGNHVSVSDVLSVAYKDGDEYASPYETSEGKIPMLVSTGRYNINTVINTAVNALTNQSSASNGIYNMTRIGNQEKFLNVSIERCKYNEADETITKLEDSELGINYDEETGEFSVDSNYYDSTADGTFHLITFNYTHSTTIAYKMQIPVFIRETVKITSHVKGIAGSSYSLEDIPTSDSEPNSGYTEVNVELRQSYTLYAEFIYTAAREEYSEILLNKSISKTNDSGTIDSAFMAGTRLTLLDVTDNKVYYYEVTAEDEANHKSKIYFTEFHPMNGAVTDIYNIKDLSDVATYPAKDEYKDICNQAGDGHTDVGMEQFLIVVDESNTNANTNVLYNLYVQAEEEDNENLFQNAQYSNPCYVKVNEIPGLYKILSGSDDYAMYKDSIAGLNLPGKDKVNIENQENSQISRDSSLTLNGSAYVLSPSALKEGAINYWNFATGNLKPQYLDFAISLQEATTDKRVTIPKGTLVHVTVGDKQGTFVATGSEFVYCYYDTQSDKPNPGYDNINDFGGDKSIDFEVTFDFTSATDFSSIRSDSYEIKVELLDTSDGNYPRNGNMCDDVIIGPVAGINQRALGFALETDEIITLGMNGYNSEDTDKGRILFKSRLDFSDYMEGGNEGWLQLEEAYKNKDIVYTYVLERKEKAEDGTLKYQDFGYTESSKSTSNIKILEGQAVDTWNQITDDIIIASKTVKYTMDGTKTADDEAVEGEISRANPIMEDELTAFVNVEELLKDPVNITNYRITCYVSVLSDGETVDMSQLESHNSAKDFFVFTIAKLKTDMD